MSKVVIKHPYIIQDKKICRGSPVISGTRTRVIDIVIEYEYLGHTPDEIIVAHPYLNLSQIEYVLKEKLVIFTHDDDFLSLVKKSEVEHCGIIYVHQQKLSIGECIRKIKSLVETRSD